MNPLKNMNDALDYVEEHLTQDLDLQAAAKIACCSEYHFKRMFSFLARMPLSEYIRRRRLTLAAQELVGGRAKVIDVAIKYRYDSPDAFTRAFHAQAFRIVGITKRVTLVYIGANPEIAAMWATLGAERIQQLKEISNVEPVGLERTKPVQQPLRRWRSPL